MALLVGEVVEIKKAFKPNQKDDQGNALPIGSIEVAIGASGAHVGTMINVHARPAVFNRRIPLIGEQVLLMIAPTNDESTDTIKGAGYMYFSPLNATDDLVLHQFMPLFKRDQTKKAPAKAKRKHDRNEPGYTFPKRPKRTDFLQPFEGDDIWEGRFGHSVRFGSTVVGDMSNYDKKPTWRGTSNTDPIMIMRVRKPSGFIQENVGNIDSEFKSNAKYTIEDFGEDDASIYMATTQMLTKFKPGFSKNIDLKTSPNWKGKSQIIIDAERVILNANKDKAFIVGSKEVVITGEKILLQDKKYKVYLSDLMDWLKKWIDEDTKLSQGTMQYATACGPTSVSTNIAQYIKLSKADWMKFKLP